MRRNAALLTMLAAQLGVAVLAIFFHLRSRVAILAAFRDFGTAVPTTATIALSRWFLPSALGLSAVASVVGLVAPLRRRHRAAAVGFGLFASSAAVVFAIWAAFQAIFRPI